MVLLFRREYIGSRAEWGLISDLPLRGRFYTYRVWRLSNRNYFLTGLILVLIFCCAGCGTGKSFPMSHQRQINLSLYSLGSHCVRLMSLATKDVQLNHVIVSMQLKTYERLLDFNVSCRAQCPSRCLTNDICFVASDYHD